jgi:CRISPR-associated protein Cas2
MRRWHLVAYDVRDEQRLRRVARILSGYGERLQYSVFRCRLNPVELERLLWELGRVQEREDSLLVLPLCPQCAAGVRGRVRSEPWRAPPGYRVV